MSLKRIISESLSENPVGLKEALSEELSKRIELALEAKIEINSMNFQKKNLAST